MDAGVNIVKNTRDNEGNFDLRYLSADDATRLLMGAASAKHLGSNFLNTKALKRISPSSTKSLQKVKIGGAEYDIDPIKVSKWNPLKKKAAEAERTAKWKEQVGAAKKSALTPEEIKQIEKLSDEDFKYSIEKGEFDFDPNVIKGEPTA